MAVTQPVVLVDEIAPTVYTGRPPGDGVDRRGRWWSAAAWSAVLVVALVAVMEIRAPRPEPSAAAGGAIESDWTTAEPPAAPGLVVRVIPPDEAAAVFSHPEHRFCGGLELHLDGSPVPIRTLVETDTGLLVTFEAPAQVAPGPHAVELIGGIPAPKAMGGACRESARFRRTIAEATAHV